MSSWPVKPLSEVAEVRLGRQRAPKNHHGDRMRPYLRAANVTWAGLDLTDVKTMNFTDGEMDTYKLAPGDILLSEASGSAGEVGKPALWSGEIAECAFQNTLLRVRPEEHEPKFLLHFLRWQAMAGRFVEHSRGVGIHHLGRARLASWPTPVPPLEEQRRIVAMLEGQLSRLLVAEGSLANAHRRLDVLERAAITELVVPESARSLLRQDPALLGAEDPPPASLPAGWRWARWSEIGASENGKPFPSKEYQEVGVRLLRPGNLGPDARLRWSAANTKHLPESYRDSHEGSLLREGDLVMNLTAQSLKDDFLGRVCAVGPGDEALLNQRIARLTATGIESTHALLVFRSGLFRHYVKSLSTGSLIQHMFTKQVNRFWVPVPPKTRQLKSSVAAEQVDLDLRRQRTAIELQQDRSASLRRALLAAAFSGRLIGAEPDLSAVEETIDA